MATTNVYEVVILGAGIMGSATAYNLSKHFGVDKNPKVLLLEQFDFLHRRGSSHGESRTIRRTYFQDHYTLLTGDAFKLWKDVEEEAGTTLLTITGSIDFCKNDGAVLQTLMASCKKHNVKFEVLGQEELKARFPAMNVPTGHVALYCPEGGILRATKAVATLQSLAVRNGCELRDNCGVAEIHEQSQAAGSNIILKLITSTGEEIFTKKCVIVAGSWTKKLLKRCFNQDVPLEQIQATVAYWAVDDPQLYQAGVLPTFNSNEEPQCYGTPALEYPNLIKCCPYSGPTCDPDTRDFQPKMDAIENRGKGFLQKFLPGVSRTPVRMETCLLTETPDENYIIDTIPANQNVIVGCGFSGHGFKLGVVVGKMLTELATTGKPLYPDLQKHFALSRFQNK